MKKLVLISIILLCIPYLSFAQKDTLQKPKIYTTWIKLDRQRIRADVLYQIKDSSIIIANYLNNRDLISGKCQTTKIEYKNIGTIKIHNANSFITGALSGLIAGSLTGALIGYQGGDDPPGWFSFTAKDKAEIGAGMGGLSGLVIGAVIGSIRINIPINRSIDNFNKNKEQLRKYSYLH